MRRLLGLVVLMVPLVGCAAASTSGGPAAPGTPSPPVTVSASCPANVSESGRPPDPAGGVVPAGVTIASVLRCRVAVQPVTGKGQWQVRIAERADGAAADLRAALARASEPPTTGACPAIGMIVPYFVLVDSMGKAYLPALPHTACGLVQGQVIQALNALRFAVISSTPIRQVESELAQQTRCSQRWKDVVTLEAGSASPAGPATPWPSPPSIVRVCRYPAAQGGDAGDLISGRQFSQAQTTLLEQAILGSPAARSCTAKHTRFAVVIPAQPLGEPWYVELDGCQRVLRPNNTLGQATADLLRLLTS